MMRVAAPLTDAAARDRLAVVPLPLVDALCALWLIAHDYPGTLRLAALRDRLTVQEARAITTWFGPPLPLGLLALGLAAGEETVSDLRAVLRAAADTTVVGFALGLAGTIAADAPRSPGVFRSLMLDADWATEFVRRYLVPPPPDPAPLLAVIADPAGSRMRLMDALTPLLTTHFAPQLPGLAADNESAAARLEATFVAAPAQFIARHIPLIVTAEAPGQIVCWPSAFLAAGSIAFPVPEGGDTLVAIGAAEIPAVPGPAPLAPIVADTATYQDVYRLLADPVRWEIVRLLVAAPRYGQELSERLDLSIATVSHHLNGLKKLDLVDIARSEHRLYYHLRIDRLRGLLAGAENALLAEEHAT